MAEQFALFRDDPKGAQLQGYFNDLEQARLEGRELATTQDCEFFIFDFEDEREVARFYRPANRANSRAA